VFLFCSAAKVVPVYKTVQRLVHASFKVLQLSNAVNFYAPGFCFFDRLLLRRTLVHFGSDISKTPRMYKQLFYLHEQ